MPILTLYKDKVKQRINKFRIILIEFNNYGIIETVQNLEKLGRTIMEKLKLSLILPLYTASPATKLSESPKNIPTML